MPSIFCRINLALFIIIPVYSFTISVFKHPTTEDGEQDYLSLYGEYIYQRESCARCHTQNIEDGSGLVSLDGVGKQYSSMWHFHHLIDPRLVNPESKMPAYIMLSQKNMTKETFDGIMQVKDIGYAKSNVDRQWNIMLHQANEVLKDIDQPDFYMSGTSEMLALIGYLQSIPPSEGKLKRDSLEYQAWKEEQKVWEDLVLDSNSVVFKTAIEKKNASKGKELFGSYCFPCHGQSGEGVKGPNLTDDYWLHGSTEIEIAKTIINGNPERGMISWREQLNPEEIGSLVAFIGSLKGTNPPNAKAPQGVKE